MVQSNPPIMEKADHATPSLNDLFRGASLRHLTLYMSYGQCGMLDDILKVSSSSNGSSADTEDARSWH